MKSCCSVGAFVILASIFSHSLCRAEYDVGFSISEYSPNTRVKRAGVRFAAKLTRLGNKAFHKLMDKAERILMAEDYQVFKKVGNYDTAMEDFKHVHPQVTAISKDGRKGMAGDREVILKQQGYENNPTIYLTRKPRLSKNPKKTDIFVYKN